MNGQTAEDVVVEPRDGNAGLVVDRRIHHRDAARACHLASRLDDGGQDPRDELAFKNQIVDYSQVLRQQGGGATKEWKPGATPPEWAGE